MADRVLVVFVDALGPGQLERFGDRLACVPHRRALQGVLGYSSGALPSVLTGEPPERHGRMCLFAHRPPGAPGLLTPLTWLGLLPRIVHERAALRRMLSRVLATTAGLTGYVALHRVPPDAFRWLDLPEREDLFASADIGGAPTFLADARSAGLRVYTAQWRLGEEERWAEAHAALAKEPPDLAFLYATELDGTLHSHGNGSREAQGAAERIARRIEHARTLMHRGGARVTTIVVGDHGMADVTRVVDPRPATKRLGSDRYFVDSTMARFWGDDSALSRARLALERARVPGRWLDEVALRERRSPVDGAPYGRAVFVLDEGVLFAPSFLGGAMRGMHGYDIGTGSSFSALASDAPLPDDCRSLTDVAWMIRRTLGLSAQRAGAVA